MSALDVFGDVDHYTHYYCELQMRDLIVGGVPSDPSVIRKWLETRMELDDTALQELLDETIASLDQPMTVTEKVDALMASPTAPSVNRFKRQETGELYYETRCMKSAFKEWANSAYPGVDWPGKSKVIDKGGYRKGLQKTLEERLFIEGVGIGLGVKEPSRVEERIKQIRMKDGSKQGVISVVEVVERPLLVFTVKARDDFMPRAVWSRLWQAGEEIGLGADRGRSDGTFDLVAFDKIS